MTITLTTYTEMYVRQYILYIYMCVHIYIYILNAMLTTSMTWHRKHRSNYCVPAESVCWEGINWKERG